MEQLTDEQLKIIEVNFESYINSRLKDLDRTAIILEFFYSHNCYELSIMTDNKLYLHKLITKYEFHNTELRAIILQNIVKDLRYGIRKNRGE